MNKNIRTRIDNLLRTHYSFKIENKLYKELNIGIKQYARFKNEITVNGKFFDVIISEQVDEQVGLLYNPLLDLCEWM